MRVSTLHLWCLMALAVDHDITDAARDKYGDVVDSWLSIADLEDDETHLEGESNNRKRVRDDTTPNGEDLWKRKGGGGGGRGRGPGGLSSSGGSSSGGSSSSIGQTPHLASARTPLGVYGSKGIPQTYLGGCALLYTSYTKQPTPRHGCKNRPWPDGFNKAHPVKARCPSFTALDSILNGNLFMDDFYGAHQRYVCKGHHTGCQEASAVPNYGRRGPSRRETRRSLPIWGKLVSGALLSSWLTLPVVLAQHAIPDWLLHTVGGTTTAAAATIPAVRSSDDVPGAYCTAAYIVWCVFFIAFAAIELYRRRDHRRLLLGMVVFCGVNLLGSFPGESTTLDSLKDWGALALTVSLWVVPVWLDFMGARNFVREAAGAQI